MKLLVHPLQTRHVDMGIELRRRDTGMAQHFLDLSQIGAAGQQMGCEAVA